MKTKPMFPVIKPTSKESTRLVALKADCQVPCYIAVAVLQNMENGKAESSELLK